MSEREQFEAWMRDCGGYPYAGQYANLMWKAWQASRRSTLEEAAQMFDALGKDLAASQVHALAASDSEGERS